VQGAVIIDGTTADITADDNQAAGSKGQAADSGHVHPATAWVPADSGLLVASFDPTVASSNSGALTVGTLYLIKLPVHLSLTLSYLWWGIVSAGSGASSGSYTGLYSSSGTLLSGSSDIGSSLAATGAAKLALTSAQALSSGSFVWAALLVNLATTQPSLAQIGGS
jgi:hypothetical protein